jgi:hypothetical protein
MDSGWKASPCHGEHNRKQRLSCRVTEGITLVHRMIRKGCERYRNTGSQSRDSRSLIRELSRRRNDRFGQYGQYRNMLGKMAIIPGGPYVRHADFSQQPGRAGRCPGSRRHPSQERVRGRSRAGPSRGRGRDHPARHAQGSPDLVRRVPVLGQIALPQLERPERRVQRAPRPHADAQGEKGHEGGVQRLPRRAWARRRQSSA